MHLLTVGCTLNNKQSQFRHVSIYVYTSVSECWLDLASLHCVPLCLNTRQALLCGGGNFKPKLKHGFTFISIH